MELQSINNEIANNEDFVTDIINIDLSNLFTMLIIGSVIIIIAKLYFKSNIKTVNMDKTNTDYEPVDRNTALGNPFKLKDFPLIESLKSYKGYLNYKVYIEKDQAIIDQLNDLYRKSKEGKLNLGCHCKPLPCHSDIIAKFVRKMKGEL